MARLRGRPTGQLDFLGRHYRNVKFLFGLLKARRGASLEAMDTAILGHAKARFCQ